MIPDIFCIKMTPLLLCEAVAVVVRPNLEGVVGPVAKAAWVSNIRALCACLRDRMLAESIAEAEAAGGQVEAKWGVPPGLIPDVLALTGDAADNIPGIEGVGPKTAAKLVREYGRVLDLIDHPEMIKNEKLRAKVAGDTARLRANLELVRLDHDLPLPTPLEDLAVVPDIGAVTALARKCEFRGLLAEYEKLSVAAISPAQGELF